MTIRRCTPDDEKRLDALFAIAFESSLPTDPVPRDFSRVHPWAVFDGDGTMTSCLTVTDYSVHFDGHICPMGGIGGVATLPPFRRRGGVRGCFEAALPDMYRSGYDFSYLYPFSTAFYRKFGYECCVQRYGWAVRPDRLTPPDVGGTLRLAEAAAPMAEAIRAVDSVWETQFNMAVLHGPADYVWAEKSDPAVKQEFTYVWFDPQGAPGAYTTFRKADEADGRNLVCSRFCFLSRDGFYALMGLFKSLGSDHTFVKFQTPAIPALQYLMPEWSLGDVRWEVISNAGMVRVINVQSVLEKARYIGSGHLTLEIKDAQIQENCGRFTLLFENGRATSVTVSRDDPDAAMDISTFSALIAGVSDFSDAAQWFSGLDIKNPSAGFSQVFYKKPLMIADYF